MDEGGNLDFSPSGTKFFILTSISAWRPFTAFQSLGSYKFDLIEYGLASVFFYCTEDNRHIRQRVFGILQDNLTGLRAASMLIIFFIYSKISAFWVDIGGINTDPFDYQILRLELPLIVVVSLVFFCKRASGFLFKFILPFFPVLSFYIIFDIFYTFLKRSPHPSDLRNINTVMDFSLFIGYLSISVFIVILLLSVFFLHSKIENEYSVKSFSLSIIKRISILVCMFSVFFCSSGRDFFVKKFNYIDWSHERTIRSNGRMASFIYYGLQEKKNRETLNNFLNDKKSNDMSIYDMLYPDFHLKKEKNREMFI